MFLSAVNVYRAYGWARPEYVRLSRGRGRWMASRREFKEGRNIGSKFREIPSRLARARSRSRVYFYRPRPGGRLVRESAHTAEREAAHVCGLLENVTGQARAYGSSRIISFPRSPPCSRPARAIVVRFVLRPLVSLFFFSQEMLIESRTCAWRRWGSDGKA